jgi:excisionase family DNA binding protein
VIDIIRQNEQPVDPSSEGSDRLLTAAEVADLFRVGKRTIGEWARKGRVTSVRTPDGHRRYREASIRALLAEVPEGVSA